MLSEKNKQFLRTWEREREMKSRFVHKLLSGLPMAMMFSLPIIILIFVVYFFFPEWYTRISNTSQGTFVTIVIAVILIALFFSVFRMHYKWEMNDQLYHELKVKEDAENQLPETV